MIATVQITIGTAVLNIESFPSELFEVFINRALHYVHVPTPAYNYRVVSITCLTNTFNIVWVHKNTNIVCCGYKTYMRLHWYTFLWIELSPHSKGTIQTSGG